MRVKRWFCMTSTRAISIMSTIETISRRGVYWGGGGVNEMLVTTNITCIRGI